MPPERRRATVQRSAAVEAGEEAFLLGVPAGERSVGQADLLDHVVADFEYAVAGEVRPPELAARGATNGVDPR